jgi:hypothetical protein
VDWRSLSDVLQPRRRLSEEGEGVAFELVSFSLETLRGVSGLGIGVGIGQDGEESKRCEVG